MNKTALTIVKIGGNIIDDAAALTRFLVDFNRLEGRKILVHGGGKLATDLAPQLGISSQMHAGRRITDAASLQLVTMVYAGWINKSLVAKLQALGCNALGLSGADGNCLASVKRAPQPIDFGYVGDVTKDLVNLPLLQLLLQQQLCPVFCAITHDQSGSLLNTNADSIAFVLAAALAEHYQVRLWYCFEKNGVLLDLQDDTSLIRELSYAQLLQLQQQAVIHSGMLPKLENAFAALRHGVAQVQIKHAHHLFSQIGTNLRLE